MPELRAAAPTKTPSSAYLHTAASTLKVRPRPEERGRDEPVPVRRTNWAEIALVSDAARCHSPLISRTAANAEATGVTGRHASRVKRNPFGQLLLRGHKNLLAIDGAAETTRASPSPRRTDAGIAEHRSHSRTELLNRRATEQRHQAEQVVETQRSQFNDLAAELERATLREGPPQIPSPRQGISRVRREVPIVDATTSPLRFTAAGASRSGPVPDTTGREWWPASPRGVGRAARDGTLARSAEAMNGSFSSLGRSRCVQPLASAKNSQPSARVLGTGTDREILSPLHTARKQLPTHRHDGTTMASLMQPERPQRPSVSPVHTTADRRARSPGRHAAVNAHSRGATAALDWGWREDYGDYRRNKTPRLASVNEVTQTSFHQVNTASSPLIPTPQRTVRSTKATSTGDLPQSRSSSVVSSVRSPSVSSRHTPHRHRHRSETPTDRVVWWKPSANQLPSRELQRKSSGRRFIDPAGGGALDMLSWL
jgi:hypothetical protein